MRVAVVAVLFAASQLFAQNGPANLPQACGSRDQWFSVKLEQGQHPSAAPEPGKALLYFVQSVDNLDNITEIGGLTTAVGLDGAWVGAVKNNSYFSVSVEPGEHHICTRFQTRAWGQKKPEGLAHFTAEAGKVYYFHTRLIVAKEIALEFGPADRDQALNMIDSDRLSVSQPKK